MRNLVEASNGRIGLGAIAEMFQDHDNFPGSICRHANPEDSVHGFIETVFAMIIEPEKGPPTYFPWYTLFRTIRNLLYSSLLKAIGYWRWFIEVGFNHLCYAAMILTISDG